MDKLELCLYRPPLLPCWDSGRDLSQLKSGCECRGLRCMFVSCCYPLCVQDDVWAQVKAKQDAMFHDSNLLKVAPGTSSSAKVCV